MSEPVIVGSNDRRDGFKFGKYKVNIDVFAEIDGMTKIRDEIILLTNTRGLYQDTVRLLFKICEELNIFEEV